MKKILIAFSAFVILGGLARGLRAQGLDQYGGSLDLQCPKGATGHFYAQEIGNRWWLCDPLGNVFFSNSVFDIYVPNYGQNMILDRYGNVTNNWANATMARLQNHGWNTIDGGATAYLWFYHAGLNIQMPLMAYPNTGLYTEGDNFSYCAASDLDGVKRPGQEVDPTYYTNGYPPTVADPFDPCYITWWQGLFNDPEDSGGASEFSSPWTLGIQFNEGDYFNGFGAGPHLQDGPTGGYNTSQGWPTEPTSYNNENLGLTVLLTSPLAESDGDIPVFYSRNREMYAKTEFANWLQGNGQVSFLQSTSASSSSNVVTLTFSSNIPLPYSALDHINVTTCSNPAFDVSGVSVSAASSHSITYNASAGTASGVTGCLVSSVSTAITGATLASGVETITMGFNPFKIGDVVTIRGVTPSTFNTPVGTGCNLTAYTATTFTCTNGSGSATYASGGSVSAGPGYTLAALNTAWGSSYDGFGSDGVHYSDVISTEASPNDCNRTTWVCSGTLSHVPSMYSFWVMDDGVPLAGAGNRGGPGYISSKAGVWSSSAGMSYTTGAFSFTIPSTIVIPTIGATSASGSVTQTVASNAQIFSVSEAITINGCASTTYKGSVYNNPYSTTITAVSSSAPWTITYADSSASGSAAGCYITAALGAANTISIDYYSGGFAVGNGLLDEAGQHSWIPADEESLVGAGTTDAFRNDMNNFIYHYASVYFDEERNISKAYDPNTMYLISNEAGESWCTPSRVPALRAIGEYADMAPIGSVVCGDPSDQARVDYIEKYMDNMPIMQWTGIAATNDNSVYPQVPTLPTPLLPANQAARGNVYLTLMKEMVNMQIDPGNGAASGQYPFVGIHWWEGGRDDNTQGNWGLTTYPLDNVYDGRCATQAASVNYLGYVCGGEPANYGDSADSIATANSYWLTTIPRKQTSGAVGGSTQ